METIFIILITTSCVCGVLVIATTIYSCLKTRFLKEDVTLIIWVLISIMYAIAFMNATLK